MRHPPSPLLLSARKRRPRRNPPRGAGLASAGGPPPEADASNAATSGEKCARCWRVLEEVVSRPDTHLCDRCTDALAALPEKVPA